MNRREFLRICSTLMGSLPVFAALKGCAEGDDDPIDVRFSGKIIIVGAGAAGLAAGYMLQRYGIEFELLEASSIFGGRVRADPEFVDFPIDLGAEWIHARAEILAELVDDSENSDSVELVPYSPETLYTWDGHRLKQRNWAGEYYSELKFKHSTWYDFLAKYIAAPITEHIRYQTAVSHVNLHGPKVQLTTGQGHPYVADRVLLTVPVTILRAGLIEFTPPLPSTKIRALSSIYVPDGIKVFVEFSKRFYPDMLVVGPLLGAEARNKLYYDAAFRKDARRHVLALFWVGPGAEALTELADDQAVIAAVLAELDDIFEGEASKSYLGHRVQNWSKEPYIHGSYSFDFEGDPWSTIEDLIKPVDDRLYFAGEATSQDNWSTVHGAMQSGYAAVRQMLETP